VVAEHQTHDDGELVQWRHQGGLDGRQRSTPTPLHLPPCLYYMHGRLIVLAGCTWVCVGGPETCRRVDVISNLQTRSRSHVGGLLLRSPPLACGRVAALCNCAIELAAQRPPPQLTDPVYYSAD
jgi:hypothetical protein